MPPRRTRKLAKESSSGSESDHETAQPSIVSRIASKVKAVVGLESEPEKPATAGSKKRKRASSIERVEEEEAVATSPKKKTPSRKTPAAKTKTNVKSPTKPPPKRPRKAVAVAATGEDGPNSESSEDELAVAPVSPVKPRVKGKSKATTKTKAATTTPSKVKTTRSGKSARTRKQQDEYDSSIRELTHSSASPTPSEDSDSQGSADYDPKLDNSRNKSKAELDESEAEEAALETMEVGSDALDDESDFGPHKIAERAASASPKKKGAKAGGRKSTGASGQKRVSTSERKSASARGRKSVGKVAEEEHSGEDDDASDQDEELEGRDRRKSAGTARGRKSVGVSGRKSTGKATKKDSEDEYVSDDDDGPMVVGKIVKAPETGRVPPGQISQNTFDFLMNLQDPAKNDREWFKLHEPVFRLAEKEWVAFVEAWVAVLVEVDDEIPPLPPKDVIHRIYRDMRFSNDKTPYKRNFSASTSRSGRKGIFAAFKPGNESLVAAGVWCPGKNEVQSIRNVILRNHGRRLRQIIAEPSFVKLFGPPKPLATKKGQEPKRQSIFGGEDELKVAPAGVNKNHRDIDLLKCRSFAVVHRFTDAQVLRKDFLEKTLRPVLEELRPFVHCLNDYMTIPLDDMSDASSSSSSSSSSSDNE
ncbi:hypothetical protein FRC07_007350 [Ceratobasidium sp. 392]|nr:hypothetical protein FRC07_007350 [Ceratobasidium sp. 392]